MADKTSTDSVAALAHPAPACQATHRQAALAHPWAAEMAPGVVADFDSDGRLVGIDIDHASQVADLTRLEADSIPLASVLLTAAEKRMVPPKDRPV